MATLKPQPGGSALTVFPRGSAVMSQQPYPDLCVGGDARDGDLKRVHLEGADFIIQETHARG